MRRIEALAKRLAKLEAVKAADEQPFVMAVHSGEIIMTGAAIDRMLRAVDGKTRGIPQ